MCPKMMKSKPDKFCKEDDRRAVKEGALPT